MRYLGSPLKVGAGGCYEGALACEVEQARLAQIRPIIAIYRTFFNKRSIGTSVAFRSVK